MSRISENQLSDSFELSRKFAELKESIEKDYTSFKAPSMSSPMFGVEGDQVHVRQESNLLRTENEEKVSLRDYLLSNVPREKSKESLRSRSDEIFDLERSRLEMRLTSLLEKERDIFNKTRDLDEVTKQVDELNIKSETTNDDLAGLRSRRVETTLNYEEFRDKEKELMEIISKLNERCEENDILINNLAKEKVELYESLIEERHKNSSLSQKLDLSTKELNLKLSQSIHEKRDKEEDFQKKLKELREELEEEKSKSRKMEKEMFENEKQVSFKKEKIESDIKNLKEELSFIKNLKDVVSQTNEYQGQKSEVSHQRNISMDEYLTIREKYQKLRKKYQKLKQKSQQDFLKLSRTVENLAKKPREEEPDEVKIVNSLRENIHELNSRLNELSKQNFELNEQNAFLQFQIKNLRNKDVSLPTNELLEEKLNFVSKKNEALVLENNRLNNKENESAKKFKEGIIEEMRSYTEKERKNYLKRIQQMKEELNTKDNYIRILEKSKSVFEKNL